MNRISVKIFALPRTRQRATQGNAIARMLLVAEIYFQLTTWRQRSVIQDPVLALVGPESSETHSQGQGLQTYTKYSIGKLNCFL